MATDGPTPPPCRADIFEHGEVVAITHTIGGSNAIESYVKEIAKISGQPVDWYFVGGRVVIKALGDTAAAKLAIAQLVPLHNKMRAIAEAEFRDVFP